MRPQDDGSTGDKAPINAISSDSSRSDNSRQYALIVAGGRGTRMQSEVPKQFMMLRGRPVLMHTLQAFHCFSADMPIILVLPASDISLWTSLCRTHGFTVPHQVVAGGSSRTASVSQGLQAIAGPEGYVAIHDGVRPLVTADLIARSFRLALEKGNAVAAVRLKDSIRRMVLPGEEASQAEDREHFRIIQTPQVFRLSDIREAYRKVSPADVLSDDASVVERCGWPIHLVEGDYRNLKITTPEDLRIAEALLESSAIP